MASEITVSVGVSVVNGNLRAQFPQVSLTRDQAAAGMSDQVLSIGTSEENVAFGDVSAPGLTVLHNLDSSNYVLYGVSDGGTMKDLCQLNAGDKHVIRIGSGKTLRMKANAAACKVRVFCLES